MFARIDAQIACVIGNSLVRLYDLDTRLHQDLADTVCT